jgi:hypothetical protein
MLDGLEVALVLLASGFRIGEGDAGSGDIPPGIPFEVESERLFPSLEPDANTHATLLGVVEFTANDCLIESECHVGVTKPLPAAEFKAQFVAARQRSSGVFYKFRLSKLPAAATLAAL